MSDGRVSKTDISMAKSIDLEDYINQYIIPNDKVYFEGFNRSSMMKCPLHKENTPSFKVYQDTNTWHCFGGCGTGDIISFIRNYEGYDFKEAVLHVLDIAGITPTHEDLDSMTAKDKSTEKSKLKLKLKINDSLGNNMSTVDRTTLIIRADRIKTLDIYEKFCRLISIEGMTPEELTNGMNSKESKYFNELSALDDAYTDYAELLNSERFNTKAFDNLLNLRGFHTEDILGLLQEQLAFYVLEGKEVQHSKWAEEMYTFGTWSRNTSAPIFYNSYVFPIFGLNGKVQGLTSYQASGKSKYLYATSPYVNRNDLIYYKRGFKSWEGTLIVCEGLFDALRIMSLGFDNVISTLGAHESLLHKRVLSQAEHIILVPDRDTQGKKILDYWKSCNPSNSVLYVPYGYKDPDQFGSEGISQEQMMSTSLNKALEEKSAGAEYTLIL
jgi:DNA primase